MLSPAIFSDFRKILEARNLKFNFFKNCLVRALFTDK